MAVGRLAGAGPHGAVHGPEGVAHRATGRQVGVGQQDAEAITALGAGILHQVGQLRFEPLTAVEGGLEAGLTGLHPQIGEQGAVMDPIENAGDIGAQGWHRSGRQHEQVALAPGALDGIPQVRPLALDLAVALEHKEQGAAGPGRGGQAVASLETQEAGSQPRAGGRGRAAQFGAGIEGQQRRRP